MTDPAPNTTEPPVGAAPGHTLLFLHLPKAAGSTMKNVLRNVYSDERVRPFHGDPADYEAVAALTPGEWEEFDVLAGHFFYGIHRHAPTETTYFTMLRDPIDQVVSLFYHAKRDPRHWLYERLAACESVAAFIAEHRPRVANNMNVRMLAGEDYGRPDFGAVTAEMLEVAKRRLAEDVAAFGLVERFDDSLALLGRALRWPAVGFKRRNVTENRPRVDDLTDADRHAIEDTNALDADLYAFAAALFEQRAADHAR